MSQHQYTVVTRTYAEALFAGARRLGIVQRALEEAKVLGRILVQTPQLATFLDHPRIARETKLATLERVFRTRVSPLMLNLRDSRNLLAKFMRALNFDVEDGKGEL